MISWGWYPCVWHWYKTRRRFISCVFCWVPRRRASSRRRTLSDLVDPSRYRARIIASFMVAIPLANFIGSPLSGLILSLDGWLGLRGWHLLFIIEGLPAVLLGIAAWFVLRDRPHQANWLNAEQKNGWKRRLKPSVNSKKYRTPDDMAVAQASSNLAAGADLRRRVISGHHHQRLVTAAAEIVPP